LPFVPHVIAAMRTAPRRVAPSRAGNRSRPHADAIARASKVASTIAITSAHIVRA
jgi:hypothetical protein